MSFLTLDVMVKGQNEGHLILMQLHVLRINIIASFFLFVSFSINQYSLHFPFFKKRDGP